MVNKESDHLMDIIIDPLTEEQVESPKENTIFPEIAKEDPTIEFPYFDFVIGDRPLKLEDHVQMDQIQDLKHPFI